MRSQSMTTPMLTLPHDALSEIALRLPAVGSTKPWRDVNSLALTCVRLRQWNKKLVEHSFEAEWCEVEKELNKVGNWHTGLVAIISRYENSPTRLYREPILRKIANSYVASHLGKKNKDHVRFLSKIFKNREAASFEEVSNYIDVVSSSRSNIKMLVEMALPAMLQTLSSNHRQQVLRLMFVLLDAHKNLGSEIKNNYGFYRLEMSLKNDQQSEVYLKLSLISRELLDDSRIQLQIKKSLNQIPSDKRWQWMIGSFPEFLETSMGKLAMLRDPDCRSHFIAHLNKSFLAKTNDIDRIIWCQKIHGYVEDLHKCQDGKKLAKTIIHWFLKAPIIKNPKNDALHNMYVKTLIQHLDIIDVKSSHNKSELLEKKMIQALCCAVQSKKYNQSTSLLIAMAKRDCKYFPDVYKFLNNKKTLSHALSLYNTLSDLHMQYKYISVLKNAAKKFFCSDKNLLDELAKKKSLISNALINF